MVLHCPVLTAGNLIPNRFAFRGVPGAQNTSLPFRWSAQPPETRSFALTIVDRHPVAHNWLHWCVVNIPGALDHLPEGASGSLPGGSIELRNSFGGPGYGGPKPPRGSGPHEYVMTVYALSVVHLPVSAGSAFEEAMKEVERHRLATASTVGLFEQ